MKSIAAAFLIVLGASIGTVAGPAATVELVERLAHAPDAPRRVVLEAALAAYERAVQAGQIERRDLLTIIDYTRPSTERRLWVFDLSHNRVLFHELVAHGRNSGDNIARFFSNTNGSLKTSLGLFVTGQPYVGSNGYSLRLRGLDRGLNDNALARAIVMHGAAYVSETVAATLGRLGRSFGCPAVRTEIARQLIDTLKGGSAIFAYGPGLGVKS